MIEKVVHGLMSGGWRRGTVSGPQCLQPDAWTAPDLSATAPVLDSVTALADRLEAENHEQALHAGAPISGDVGPHLIVGYGRSVWNGNVALVQTTQAQVRRVFQAQVDRDNGVHVDSDVIADPELPDVAVDAPSGSTPYYVIGTNQVFYDASGPIVNDMHPNNSLIGMELVGTSGSHADEFDWLYNEYAGNGPTWYYQQVDEGSEIGPCLRQCDSSADRSFRREWTRAWAATSMVHRLLLRQIGSASALESTTCTSRHTSGDI